MSLLFSMGIKFIQYSRDFPSGNLMVFMNGIAKNKCSDDDDDFLKKENNPFGFGKVYVKFNEDLFQKVPIYSPSGKLLSYLPSQDISKLSVEDFDEEDFYDFKNSDFLITKNLHLLNHKFIYPSLKNRNLDVALIELKEPVCAGIYDGDELLTVNYCSRFFDLLKFYGSALDQKFNGSKEIRKEYVFSKRIYDQAKRSQDPFKKISLEAASSSKRDEIVSKIFSS